MNKTRKLLCLFLAVLLVVIQQIGFAHALTHLVPAQQNSRPDKPHPAEKVCIECLAFAQIGGGLMSAAPPVAPVSPPVVALAVQSRVHTPAFVSHFLSRAPPDSAS
jgi:hypothetical protein